MKEIKKRSDCPISNTLEIFGDKWSLLIIRDLMLFGKSTYNDFLKSDEKIATNILASRLKGLEENGIIEKSAHPESKAKILYKLTPKGIDLLPLLVEINLWADQYLGIPPRYKEMLKEAKKDKQVFIKKMKKELEKNNSISV
ncbi:MAG: helix-turn-helix domain-containing protein [Cruoricaptor ignavus]|nr:helix-turn-helix domain-containing protein [Cruoricaptor ignavus]